MFWILFTLTNLSAFAQTANVKNVQLHCNVSNGNVIIVGNDTDIMDQTHTQTLTYVKSANSSSYTLHSQIPAAMQVLPGKDAMNKDFKVKSADVDLDLNLFKFGFAWYAATINGLAARCGLDALFFSGIHF